MPHALRTASLAVPRLIAVRVRSRVCLQLVMSRMGSTGPGGEGRGQRALADMDAPRPPQGRASAGPREPHCKTGRRAPVDWLMPRPRVSPPCHSFLRWQSWASASSSLETGREGIAHGNCRCLNRGDLRMGEEEQDVTPPAAIRRIRRVDPPSGLMGLPGAPDTAASKP